MPAGRIYTCSLVFCTFQELLKFIKYILRKFFEAFERNPHVAVEALFFKSTKESVEAFGGYGTYEPAWVASSAFSC